MRADPRILLYLLLTVLGTRLANAGSSAAEKASAKQLEACTVGLARLGLKGPSDDLNKLCSEAQVMGECRSVKGAPIAHFDFAGAASDEVQNTQKESKARKILVFGVIHGDEPLSGQMVAEWALRLREITHRNDWRIIPILNPDGLEAKTRTNSNGVDLNRNFPTRDWNDEAVRHWRAVASSEKRRYPGATPASEPETKCAMAHIQDYQPDFIVSIHTPYNVLDFDGPKTELPKFKPIPWRNLGNFPGSLGRLGWRDHQIPVLTVELKDRLVNPGDLQDMIGTFALQSTKLLGKRNTSVTRIGTE